MQRYREERGLGREPEDAVAVSVMTAGRTISFSALTVATALCGLFVFRLSIFRALGAAGVTVVLVALLVGLTLTPALLSTFHRRIRVPAERVSDDGFFARMARATQRHAAVVTVGLSVLLLALAVPFLSVTFQNGGADLLPKDFEARRFAEGVARAFPDRATEPVVVVAKVPAAELQSWAAGAADLPGVERVAPAVDRERGWSAVEITPKGTAQGEQAKALVHALRADRPPYPIWVTGPAGILVDFQDLVLARAAMGRGDPGARDVRAAVPHDRVGAGAGQGAGDEHPLAGGDLRRARLRLPGRARRGAAGLHADGGAGDLGAGDRLRVRVRALDGLRGLPAVADQGAATTPGCRTTRRSRSGCSAAAASSPRRRCWSFIVFLGFTTGKLLGIKQMGLAMATAVAVDATLVRCLLVPATMTLLGDWNWWAPGWLRRIHNRLGLQEHVTPPPLPAAAVPGTRPRPRRRGR